MTDRLKVLDRKTRKMMKLYGVLHPKSNVDRVYIAQQKGGRRLITCEMCVKAEENSRLIAGIGIGKIKILDSQGGMKRTNLNGTHRMPV